MARSNTKRKETVLRAYGRSCAWCSIALTRSNASIDHVRCLSCGGSNWVGNLLPSCIACNEARGDLDARSWLSLCLQAGKAVRVDLVREAITRAEGNPRSGKEYEIRFQEAEQKKRMHNWRLARAVDALFSDVAWTVA